jgi:hypothetical protein
MARPSIRSAGFLIGPSRWGASPGLRVVLVRRRRADEDERSARALVALADAMRDAAGIACGASTHGAGADGEEWLVLAAPREEIGLILARGLESVLRALPGAPADAVDTTLRALVASWDVPIETGRLAEAAREAGIPARFLDATGASMVLGLGARRRLYHMHSLGDAGGLDAIADDKIATSSMLAAAGIPCTHPVRVTSPRDAARAAGAMGYPVVLKPNMSWQQVGVFTNLTSDAAVARAFRAARRHAGALGGDVLVEEHRPGLYVRATVIGGALASIASATTPRVTGDGVRTAEALARRSFGLRDGETFPQRGLGILEAAFAAQGLTRASVPARGRRVAIGLSSHGTFTNFTDTADATLRDVLARVAALFPLPALGIDLLVRRPQHGFDPRTDVVLEVNTRPMLYIGHPTRNIAAALLRHFYPRGARDAKVPVVLAPPGGDRAVIALGRKLARAGLHTAGYASRKLWWGDPSKVVGHGADAARLLALDPRAEALLLALDDDVLDRVGLSVPAASYLLAGGAWPEGLSRRGFIAPGRLTPRTPAEVATRILRMDAR